MRLTAGAVIRRRCMPLILANDLTRDLHYCGLWLPSLVGLSAAPIGTDQLSIPVNHFRLASRGSRVDQNRVFGALGFPAGWIRAQAAHVRI